MRRKLCYETETQKLLNYVRGTIICSLSAALFVPSVIAGSTTIQLYNNEYKACSTQVGNTTGKYSVDEKTYSTSDYSVDLYMYYGQTSNHCGIIKDHWAVAPGKTKTKTYSINKKYGTVARITLYGNLKNNQKKECRAKGTLSNK